MTTAQKYIYIHQARRAVLMADMELIDVIPENDYIEAWCPRCKKMWVFSEHELRQIRCSTCDDRHSSEYFYEKSKELVSAAGFELVDSSYEDDYIDVKCPQCEGITTFRFYELGNIFCKDCAMEDAAFENEFDLYIGDEFDGKAWESKVDQWINENEAKPAVLVCRECGELFIIDADAADVIDQIKHLRCKCGAIGYYMKRIASDSGFSIECERASYVHALDAGEIALLCNCCGEEFIFERFDPELENKIANLKCNCKTSDLTEDLLELTLQGKVCWITDRLRIVSIFDLTKFNEFTFDGNLYYSFPKDGSKEVFFAADPSDSDYAYAFVVYTYEKDAWFSRYLLFRFQVSTWGRAYADVDVCGRWPYYYEKLHEAIHQNIQEGLNRDASLGGQTLRSYFIASDAVDNRKTEN